MAVKTALCLALAPPMSIFLQGCGDGSVSSPTPCPRPPDAGPTHQQEVDYAVSISNSINVTFELSYSVPDYGKWMQTYGSLQLDYPPHDFPPYAEDHFYKTVFPGGQVKSVIKVLRDPYSDDRTLPVWDREPHFHTRGTVNLTWTSGAGAERGCSCLLNYHMYDNGQGCGTDGHQGNCCHIGDYWVKFDGRPVDGLPSDWHRYCHFEVVPFDTTALV